MEIFLDSKDKRLAFAQKHLNEIGYKVKDFDNTTIKEMQKNDILVLSPANKWGEQKIEKLPKDIVVFAGNIDEDLLEKVNKKKIKYINMMKNEDFVLKNANLTAEGMLADLILNTPSSIYEQNILIIGSGRVAKAVAYLLFKMGIKFDMAMRNEKEYNLSKLIASKCYLGDSYRPSLVAYNSIINTVPAVLFQEEDAKIFKEDCYLFELASKKCCLIENPKFNYVVCPALPAKYCSKTAGLLIVDMLKDYLSTIS